METESGNIFSKEDVLDVESNYEIESEHTCAKCNNTFQSINCLVEHMQKSPELFTCNLCLVSFSSRSGCDKHIATHLSKQTGKYPFTCQQCGFGSLYASQLSKHQQKAHNPLKPHTCDDCGRNFSLAKTLKVHKASQHIELKQQEKKEHEVPNQTKEDIAKEKGMRIPCEVCGKTIRRDWMVRHIQNVHKIGKKKTRIETYPKVNCQICAKGVSSKNLYCHMANVHKVRGGKMCFVTCHLCGESLQSSGLDNHVRVLKCGKYTYAEGIKAIKQLETAM